MDGNGKGGRLFEDGRFFEQTAYSSCVYHHLLGHFIRCNYLFPVILHDRALLYCV